MILCSDKNGQGPEAWLSPPRSRSQLGGRSQLVAPSGPVPRPCPAVIADGARRPGPNWPASSSNRPWGPGSQAASHAEGPAIRLQRQGWGGGSLLPQGLSPATGQPWGMLCSPAGHRTQPAPGPQLTCWPRGDRVCLWPYSLPDDDQMLLSDLLTKTVPTNSCSLTAGRSGAEPTGAPTNGWAGQPTVPSNSTYWGQGFCKGAQYC